MDRPLIDARFHDTYRIVAFLREVIGDPFGEHLYFVSDFFVDDQWTEVFVCPYSKTSALHHLIRHAVDCIYYAENVENLDLDQRKRIWTNFLDIPPALIDMAPHVLPVEHAFRAYGIEEESFIDALGAAGISFEEATSDHLYDHYQEIRLGQPYEDLVRRIVDEVFYVLFQDREALRRFALLIAQRVVSRVSQGDVDPDVALFIEGPGRLRRVAMPRWVQRAVYFRDRGRCVLCRKDLSGALSLENIGHYDHVVPLAQSGQNDVTNVQLLCQDCNLEKGSRVVTTSSLYEPWYPMEAGS